MAKRFDIVNGVIRDLDTGEHVGVAFKSFIHRTSRFPWMALVAGRWGTGSTAEKAARRALQAQKNFIVWDGEIPTMHHTSEKWEHAS